MNEFSAIAMNDIAVEKCRVIREGRADVGAKWCQDEARKDDRKWNSGR